MAEQPGGRGRVQGWIGAVGVWMSIAVGAAGVFSCAGCESAPKASSPAGAKGSYAFWPAFPEEPHIQFLANFSGSNDLDPREAGGLEKLVFGKESAGDSMAINKPYGVAAMGSNIYVCDMRSNCLVVLDLAKKQTRLVGASGVNRLNHPVDVAAASDGMIYVADNDRGSVMVFDSSERYVRPIGHEKFKPVSVAVHGDRLYVCDMTSQSVEIFGRKDGQKLGTIGTVGDEDGQFRLPLGVETDAAGNVYVVDMMRCRVQKFDPQGKFVSGVGQMGDYAGSFARPKHMAVDSDGVMYVVDAAFQNVQMFDDQQRLLMAFGAVGSFPGSMNLPVGICVTDQGLEYFKDKIHPGFEAKRLVIVTNQFGPGKVAVYAMGNRRPSTPLADLASASAAISAGMDMAPEKRDVGPQEGVKDPDADPDAADDASPPAKGSAAPAAGKGDGKSSADKSSAPAAPPAPR